LINFKGGGNKIADSEPNEFYEAFISYCKKYNIPEEYFFEILEDQKVVPMIRGKATEYSAFKVLVEQLSDEWFVHKLNLNPQPNRSDEDISIRHKRMGISLKVESKNAVRGSFRLGTGKTKLSSPHFKVKCHKSRSNLQKSKTSNDRYSTGDFDLLMSNLSNAIFEGNQIDGELRLTDNREVLEFLKNHLDAEDESEIIEKSYELWFICFTVDLVDECNFIPRTPSVELTGDIVWFKIDELKAKLRLYILKAST